MVQAFIIVIITGFVLLFITGASFISVIIAILAFAVSVVCVEAMFIVRPSVKYSIPFSVVVFGSLFLTYLSALSAAFQPV